MLLTTVGLRNTSFDGRKRRLDPRPGPFAFQAFDQPGFLAADVSGGSAMKIDVEREFLAQDVLAQQVVGIELVDGRLQPIVGQRVFVAEIDVGGLGPRGVATDDDPLEHLVGIVLHQNAVVERAGLALVGIDAHVDRAGMILGQEEPFQPGRKAGPAAPRRLLALTISMTCAGRHFGQHFAAG